MARQVMRYETEDGQVFDTMAEAEAHEAQLALHPLVVQFVDDRGWSSRYANQVMGLIADWEAWKAEPRAVEEPKL